MAEENTAPNYQRMDDDELQLHAVGLVNEGAEQIEAGYYVLARMEGYTQIGVPTFTHPDDCDHHVLLDYEVGDHMYHLCFSCRVSFNQ